MGNALVSKPTFVESDNGKVTLINPAPKGEVYWLWISGLLTGDQILAMHQKWPHILSDARTYPDKDFTIVLFRGGPPPDREVNPMVSKDQVFVLQGDADTKVMFCNRDLTPQMAQQMRELLFAMQTMKAQLRIEAQKEVKRLG
jgi:hypothetical protein